MRKESGQAQANETALRLVVDAPPRKNPLRDRVYLAMEMLYVAYGLGLASSFPLPGMRALPHSGDGFPSLELRLLNGAELEDAWSGTTEPPVWRGRQGDGRELVIERGKAGDLLFSYGDLARFRLNQDMRQLDCAPRDRGLDWQRVLISKVIPSISVMRGYEALHAAAVDSPDGVIAIMAPSGWGKSTLALELLRRGWPLFADDVLTLSAVDGVVSAHPGTSHMNLAYDHPATIDSQTLGETLGVLDGERWLVAEGAARQSRPVSTLCLLERAPGLSLEIQILQSSPLLLAPYMLGLSSDLRRERNRFDLYADLTAAARVVRLTAGLEHRPDQLADILQQSRVRKPQLISGALR